MSTLIKWIAAPMLAVGLLAVTDAPQAEAQSFSYGSRGLSIQLGQPYASYYSRLPSYSRVPSYNRAPNCYAPSYNSYRYYSPSPYRSNVGYYDYRPSQIYRYGSRYNMTPRYYGYPTVPHHRHGRGR